MNRRLLTLTLQELRLLEAPLGHLDQQKAHLLAPHHDAVQRLAEVPWPGVDSAQQIIAEAGGTAATFPSPRHLASWVGAWPHDRDWEPGSSSIAALVLVKTPHRPG